MGTPLGKLNQCKQGRMGSNAAYTGLFTYGGVSQSNTTFMTKTTNFVMFILVVTSKI
jgi:hypothetical protein